MHPPSAVERVARRARIEYIAGRVRCPLAFRCVPGAGEASFNGERAALPDALEIARAYLEFHVLGGTLVAAAGS